MILVEAQRPAGALEPKLRGRLAVLARSQHEFYTDRQLKPQYSSFRCAGNEKQVAKPSGRLCMFHNLCMEGIPPDAQQFFFKQNMSHPILYDEELGYLSKFISDQPFVYLTPRPLSGSEKFVPFAPIVVERPLPIKQVSPLGVHLLWEKRIDDNNIGHLVWDDFFSLWIGLRTFDLHRQPAKVLNVGKHCDGLCSKMADLFITKILGLQVEDYHEYAESWSNLNSPMCFTTLLVGGYGTSFFGGDTTEHRAADPTLYEYRAQALRAIGLNPDSVPRTHHIVLVEKSQSNRGAMHDIANIIEVERFLRMTYPEIRITVIDWKDIGLTDQLELLMSTTVIISPAGGVSTLLPFLPNGAHAILMDFPLIEEEGGSKSVSMEGGFWDHWSHIKNDYYIVNKSEQYVWQEGCDASKEDCNLRDHARVVIDVTQLQLLIDGAFAEMDFMSPVS